VEFDGIDLFETLLTTDQAAALAGVNPATVRSWKSRGHLVAASYDPAGRPLFLGIDVAKAEHATRHRQPPRRIVAA
jgi:hypothetical protein